MNATINYADLNADIPKTIDGNPPYIKNEQKDISRIYYSMYALRGFTTLQSLINRFIICLPDWNSNLFLTNGICQHNTSTSDILTDNDIHNYLKKIENDIFINTIFSLYNNIIGKFIPNLYFNITNIPLFIKKKFIRPLRQAPQSYINSGVSYPFPTKEYVSAPFYDSMKDIFGIAFILSYLYLISRIITIFMQEKEFQMKEMMKILGVYELEIIISWYITYIIIIFISCISQSIFVCIGLYPNSNSILLLLFFYLFGLNILSFSYFISSFFNNAKIGSYIGLIIFFLMYFVSYGYNNTCNKINKFIGSFLPPISFNFGIELLSKIESTSIGINLSNWIMYYDNYTFHTTFICMLIHYLYEIQCEQLHHRYDAFLEAFQWARPDSSGADKSVTRPESK